MCAYVCNTLIDREDFDETPPCICERNSIIKATCTIFIPYLPASESSRNDSHRHKSKAGSFSSEEAASWECLCLMTSSWSPGKAKDDCEAEEHTRTCTYTKCRGSTYMYTSIVMPFHQKCYMHNSILRMYMYMPHTCTYTTHMSTYNRST